MEALANTTRVVKEIKCTQTGKNFKNPYLLTNVWLSYKNLMEVTHTHTHKTVSDYKKIVKYLNVQTSVIIIYTKYDQGEFS